MSEAVLSEEVSAHSKSTLWMAAASAPRGTRHGLEVRREFPHPGKLGTHLPGTGTAPTGSCPGWGTSLQSRSHLLPPGRLAAPGTGLGGAHVPEETGAV